MKHRLVLGLCAALLMAAPGQALAGLFDDLLHGAGKVLQEEAPLAASLSRGDIAAGLKQALEKGTTRTVKRIGHADGYWKNPRIRIPLPDKWQRPARLLAKAGMGSYAEDLQKRINRAAEIAAPLARPIFLDAIRQMRFSDVQRIWKGPDDAATRYFEDKTRSGLTAAFSPLVHKELQRSGAVRSWRRFSQRYAELPFIGGYLKDDLDAYATRMALAGMFTILADEEAKIRHDPAARTTQLLRRVFQ
ncbi:MAG: DUF4197 domain-containing protein [Mariprofundaceae bacterium]